MCTGYEPSISVQDKCFHFQLMSVSYFWLNITSILFFSFSQIWQWASWYCYHGSDPEQREVFARAACGMEGCHRLQDPTLIAFLTDLEKLVELLNCRLILWKLAKVCISCLMEALQRVQNGSSRWAHVSWAVWKSNALPGGLHYSTWSLPDEAKSPLQHDRKSQHHRGHGGSFRAYISEMAEPNTSFKVAQSQRGAFLSSDPPCILIQTAKLC